MWDVDIGESVGIAARRSCKNKQAVNCGPRVNKVNQFVCVKEQYNVLGNKFNSNQRLHSNRLGSHRDIVCVINVKSKTLFRKDFSP